MDEKIIEQNDKIILSENEEIKSDDNGTAFVTNNQNGMGGIVSPQP